MKRKFTIKASKSHKSADAFSRSKKAIKAAKVYSDRFSSFRPWSGAVYTYNALEMYDRLDEFEQYLDDIYYDDLLGEGIISETELNNLLWFDAATICEVVGLYYDDKTQAISDEPFDEANIEESVKVRKHSVMASAWVAPNGRKYGKQTKRFPDKYLFTKRELNNMVDSGVAEDMAGTFDPMSMNYDIIGISWNETNGYRSGILIQDTDTGNLYVGNSGDANRARL